MPRFAANLSMMYGEFPFEDRFAAAAGDGFQAVECLFPYEFPARQLAKRLADAGLQPVLFNLPPGDWQAGERGLACLPDRQAQFRDALKQALDYAGELGCPRLHVMAGLMPTGADRQRLRGVFVDNLRWASEQAAAQSIDLMIEPINTRDIPGYFLNRQDEAHAILDEVGATNLKVQMDLYHCQIVEGDVTKKLEQYLPGGRVGHMQIAGVPQRHEPDVGELHYPYLFERIDALGYDGWIGCEYRPRAGTRAGLGWLSAALRAS